MTDNVVFIFFSYLAQIILIIARMTVLGGLLANVCLSGCSILHPHAGFVCGDGSELVYDGTIDHESLLSTWDRPICINYRLIWVAVGNNSLFCFLISCTLLQISAFWALCYF